MFKIILDKRTKYNYNKDNKQVNNKTKENFL